MPLKLIAGFRRLIKLSLLLAGCLLGLSSVTFGQHSALIHGTVSDSSTGEPLSASNIRILGTSRGTITNAEGKYTLTLDPGAYAIAFSYLGYQPDTLRLLLVHDTLADIRLRPSPIQIPEVVILAEDPAVEIIRKAIANKRSWMSRLKTYTFDAFTRQVLSRDTSIASITESYTSGYMKGGDTLREVVRQKRQTENIPIDENFAAVQRIVNFNEDAISLFSLNMDGNSSSYSFVGPTAPDALDYYNYRLEKISRVSDTEVYQIRMTPKTRLRPLFDGTIMIAEGTYAVMGVDVKPNEAFIIPFVKDLDLRYRQQFALYDTLFWMPTDIRINGGITIGFIGISVPRIGLEQVSSIYDYKINVAIADSIFQKRHRTVDSSAAKFDTAFWASHEVLPLTSEQRAAYRTLDSTQTLEKQFEPGGPLAMLGEESAGSLLDHVDFRFDRVEGFFFGWKQTIDAVPDFLTLSGSAGFGFSDERMKYSYGATLHPLGHRVLGAGGEVYRRLVNIPDEGFYGPLFNSFTALILKNDYRDYYLANGWRAFLSTEPFSWFQASVGFSRERQYTLANQTDQSLFTHTTYYRQNPPIIDGDMRSIQLDLRIGEEPVTLDLVPRKALDLSVEHSSPRIAHSAFDFTRYHGVFSWYVTPFSSSLLFPPTLRFRLSGGVAARSLPPQRSFVLDSRSSSYAPFGVLRGSDIKEFGGDRFVMLNLEQNFRSLPFLALNLPFLYRNGIELIVDASIAQTWNQTTSTSGGWYTEAGVGVSRILDLLRADLTYRFKRPADIFLTFCISNLL